MKKKKVFNVIITLGGWTAVAGLGAAAGWGVIKLINLNNESNYKEEYKDVYDYYLHTSTGAPLKLPIYNNNVAIVFSTLNPSL